MPFSSLNINPANLPQETKEIKSYGLIKILCLGVIGMGLSAFSMHLFKNFLVSANADDLIKSAIVAALFIVILILETLFIDQGIVIYSFIFLQVVAPLSLFASHIYPETSSMLLGGAAASFFFLLLGVYRAREIFRNSLEIKFFSIIKPLAPKAATAIILFFAVVFYLTYFEWGAFNETLAKKFGIGILEASDPAMKIWFPKASVDQTTKDFLAVVAEGELKKMSIKELAEKGPAKVEFNFELLKPEEKSKLIGQVTEKVKENIEGVIGPIDDTESVKDAAYRIAREYIGTLYEQTNYKSIFGIGVAFAIFIIFRSSTFFFYWIMELLALIIYKLLIATGFAYISLETARKETIVI